MRVFGVVIAHNSIFGGMIVPRSKPSNVTEHRVTLGTWEREQLKHVKEATIAKDIGIGVGIASLGIGGTYVAYKIGKAVWDWGEDIVDLTVKEVTKVATDLTDPTNFSPFHLDPLPEVPEDSTPRDDGWIFGGPPTIFQVAWENTFS